MIRRFGMEPLLGERIAALPVGFDGMNIPRSVVFLGVCLCLRGLLVGARRQAGSWVYVLCLHC